MFALHIYIDRILISIGTEHLAYSEHIRSQELITPVLVVTNRIDIRIAITWIQLCTYLCVCVFE